MRLGINLKYITNIELSQPFLQNQENSSIFFPETGNNENYQMEQQLKKPSKRVSQEIIRIIEAVKNGINELTDEELHIFVQTVVLMMSIAGKTKSTNSPLELIKTDYTSLAQENQMTSLLEQVDGLMRKSPKEISKAVLYVQLGVSLLINMVPTIYMLYVLCVLTGIHIMPILEAFLKEHAGLIWIIEGIVSFVYCCVACWYGSQDSKLVSLFDDSHNREHLKSFTDTLIKRIYEDKKEIVGIKALDELIDNDPQNTNTYDDNLKYFLKVYTSVIKLLTQANSSLNNIIQNYNTKYRAGDEQLQLFTEIISSNNPSELMKNVQFTTSISDKYSKIYAMNLKGSVNAKDTKLLFKDSKDQIRYYIQLKLNNTTKDDDTQNIQTVTTVDGLIINLYSSISLEYCFADGECELNNLSILKEVGGLKNSLYSLYSMDDLNKWLLQNNTNPQNREPIIPYTFPKTPFMVLNSKDNLTNSCNFLTFLLEKNLMQEYHKNDIERYREEVKE